MKPLLLLLCLVVLFLPAPAGPGSVDPVAAAFRIYEALWRDSRGRAAAALERGELAADELVREFLSASGQAARRQAFRPLAEAEAAALQPWSAVHHAMILRRYQQRD